MKKLNLIILLLAVFSIYSLEAQVAINGSGADADQSAILDIAASDKGVSFPNVSISDVTNAYWPIYSPKTGLVVYNTNTSTGPGLFMWDGSNWISLSQQTTSSPGSFESSSLNNNRTVNNSSWTDISGATLTFTATNTSALVQLTSSGAGSFLSSWSFDMRVWNVTDNYSVGGTNTGAVTDWNLSFSKKITGLAIGTSYTLKVQGRASGGVVSINASSSADTDHLTLSIIQ